MSVCGLHSRELPGLSVRRTRRTACGPQIRGVSRPRGLPELALRKSSRSVASATDAGADVVPGVTPGYAPWIRQSFEAAQAQAGAAEDVGPYGDDLRRCTALYARPVSFASTADAARASSSAAHDGAAASPSVAHPVYYTSQAYAHPETPSSSGPTIAWGALLFMLGAAFAVLCGRFISFVSAFVTGPVSYPGSTSYDAENLPPQGAAAAAVAATATAPPPPRRNPASPHTQDVVPDTESVEWVNMCMRKAWRVYQKGLEEWIADLLQPVFDTYINEDSGPSMLNRIRIAEFHLNHEAPVLQDMQRRTSRKDSDLNGVFSLRYSGGAKMLLVLELRKGNWQLDVPVMVEDFDLDGRMWIKCRLAPMCPYIGTISVAFVTPPKIQVQLSPYNRVPLMRIPFLQNFLRRLLTVELPSVMVLPQRLEINLPPAVTALAEAAVGRDTVMRAVASAVLQADAVEQALLSALPMEAQAPAGGISVPEAFTGELTVTLKRGRNLPVWGFPWQSNPYCRMELGSQAVQSKRDSATGQDGSHRNPVWNQEFQFLVEDPSTQELKIEIRDSQYTGKADVGFARFALRDIPSSGTVNVWLPVLTTPDPETATKHQGDLRLCINYRAFEDFDENDSGVAAMHDVGIYDVESSAAASSQAAVEQSAGLAALAVARAAAARAAARATRLAQGVVEGVRESELDDAAAAERRDAEQRYASQLVAGVRSQRAMVDEIANRLGQRASTRIAGATDAVPQQSSLAQIVADSREAMMRMSRDGYSYDSSDGSDSSDSQDESRAGPPTARATVGSAPMLYDLEGLQSVDDVIAHGDGMVYGKSADDAASGASAFATVDLPHQRGNLLPAAIPTKEGRALDILSLETSATARVRKVSVQDKTKGAEAEAEVKLIGDAAHPQIVENLRTMDLEAAGRGGEGAREDEHGRVSTLPPPEPRRPRVLADEGCVSASSTDEDEIARFADEWPAAAAAAEHADALQTTTNDIDIAGAAVLGGDEHARPAVAADSSLDGGDAAGPRRADKTVELAPEDVQRALNGADEPLPQLPPRQQHESDWRDSDWADAQRPRTGSETKAWWDVTRFWPSDASSSEDGGARAAAAPENAAEASTSADGATSAGVEAESGGEEHRPWWRRGFLPWGSRDADERSGEEAQPAPGNADTEADGTEADGPDGDGGRFRWPGWVPWAHREGSEEADAGPDAAEASRKDAAGDKSSGGMNWRDLLPRFVGGSSKEQERDEEEGREAGEVARTQRRPVERVIVSPEIPIEEIAAEIARVTLEESAKREAEERAENERLMQGPLATALHALKDLAKPELVLLCALSGGAMILLAIVAYRLELVGELMRYQNLIELLQNPGN